MAFRVRLSQTRQKKEAKRRREEMVVVVQGEGPTTKENRTPGRVAQAYILEIRRWRQGDHCKFKAPRST